ncbi:winged helix-turn-helix domain-containing protein [Microbulbifer sp. EKSA008]|uniref:winged helix-turn-helix domain-containing protein n=1 Tax=Microbulbifer sp. EKSA008 TaxID=3243367 RepID=UPI0040437356
MKVTRNIKLGRWILNEEQGYLLCGENKNQLDHIPLQVLLELVNHQGCLVTKKHLLTTVWANKVVGDEVLTVAISQIRKALGDRAKQPEYIKTISGQGYRLICTVEDIESNNKAYDVDSTWRFSKKYIVGLIASIFVFVGPLLWLFFHVDPVPSLSTSQNEKFQQGRYLLTLQEQAKWRQAQTLFEQIIIEAERFSPAYLALVESKLLIDQANTQQLLNNSKTLNKLVDKAIDLSPSNVDAYLLKARIAFHIEWNFDMADKYYQKALSLEPMNGKVHHDYSQFLLARRDYPEALQHVYKYIDSDPSAYSKPMVAWIYNMSGKYKEANEELIKIAKIAPRSIAYHVSAHSTLENMGRDADAFIHLKAILSHVGYNNDDLRTVEEKFQVGGLAAVNKWLLDIKQEAADIGQYRPPLAYARYAATAGDIERTLYYLQQAIEERQLEVLWVNTDPKYELVRSLPAYIKLMRKAGLSE